MHNSLRPRSLTPEDLERPLDFWEKGPLRQILELEFECVIDEEIRCRNVSVTTGICELIHDAVLPEVFLFLTKKIRWTTAEERSLALSVANESPIRLEMQKRVSLQFDRLGSALAQQEVRTDASPSVLGSLIRVVAAGE